MAFTCQAFELAFKMDKCLFHLIDVSWHLVKFAHLVTASIMAQKHVGKSEYNYSVLQALERLKIYDWALNVGFYAIYHCFGAILAKYGYASQNQSCTMTALLKLIEDKELDLDKDIVLQFDTLDAEESLTNPTVRHEREVSTYGVETTIDSGQLKKIKELVLEVQRETIRILAE